MKIIAIETSHDDTSVVLYENKKVLKNFAYSQTEFHKKFGGTVPEFASRKHFDSLVKILDDLLHEDLSDLDHIAYTHEPGLVGCLHMGKLFAKALALALKVEAKPINHMFGHIFAVAFHHKIIYPAIALIVSGGHTQLWHVKGIENITLIGETSDDAAGEVFDKIARALKLGFPGGPLIDEMFNEKLVTNEFDLIDKGDLNFSFSGLKTKVINYIHNRNQQQKNVEVDYVATNLQNAIVKYLIKKTTNSIKQYKPASIILGGGVAANSLLRKEFAKIHSQPLIPALEYTTDNAMMIAIYSDLKECNDK